MKTVLLCYLLTLASSAPQYTRITPETSAFGTQVISTGLTQGQHTVGFGQDQALAGVTYLANGLQTTNTFGANSATNGLSLATNTANFATVPFQCGATYGLGGLQYGLGLGQQYIWG